MTDSRHPHTTRGGRMRFVGPVCVLLAALVCLLLLPAAPAGADVMKKYRTAYKSRLTHYRNQMDVENTFFIAYRSAVESHRMIINAALTDPELLPNLPQLEAAAILERELLRDAVQEDRDKIYANIAAFRAKGVKWFETNADKKRFKARLTQMRLGFVEIYAADADLMTALLHLSSAQVGECDGSVMQANLSYMHADDEFEKGLRLLRALQ